MLQEHKIKERLEKYQEQLTTTDRDSDAGLVLLTAIQVLERVLEVGE